MTTRNTAGGPGATPGGAAGPGPATKRGPGGRVVILNALPLNALPRALLRLEVMPIDADSLQWWIEFKRMRGYEVVHYIRHPATIAALRQLGVQIDEQPSSGLYQYADGDVLVVVTLKSPQRGAEVQQVRPEDLDVRIVRVEA